MGIWNEVGAYLTRLARGGGGGFLLVELAEGEQVELLHCVWCGTPLRVSLRAGEAAVSVKCALCSRQARRTRRVSLFFRVTAKGGADGQDVAE